MEGQLAEGLSPEMIAILVGVGVVALAILLLRFGKYILYVLGGAGVLIAVIAVCSALASQSKATQRAAEAATVSAVGQTANSIVVTILAVLLVLVVLGGGGVAVYLYFRMRRAESQTGDKGWVSGPNAMWGKKNNQPTLPAMSPDAMMQFYFLTQQMQQMQTMQQIMGMLSRMSGGYIPGRPPAQLSYPQDSVLPDSDGWWPDGFEE